MSYGSVGMEAAPPFMSIADILAHSRFDEAFDAFMDEVWALYSSESRMRSMLEYRQTVCFQLLVCFDAARDPERPETLFTAARVISAMAEMGIRNQRAVAELIGRLRDDGYVTVRRADHDQRVQEFQATEKARAADREWLVVLHRPLEILEPGERRFHLGAHLDEGYQRAFRTMSLTSLAVANQVMVTNPEADYFVKAKVGSRIMTALLRAIRGRPDRRTDPGFYGWAAERSAVSRPHVRKLLLGAEERGLVVLSGGKAVTVEVTPLMIEGVRHWAATALSATDLVSALAWREMTRPE